jgi:P-type E1-E2 ATPase
VTIEVEIPGREPLGLEHLVLDLNGTLTDRGELIEGVAERLAQLHDRLEVHVLSADTYGTLAAVAAELGADVRTVVTGEEKARHVSELGGERCAAVGNGANDAAMLEAAALGIAVIGPEGVSSSALRSADVVCTSILDALDLLLHERTLIATLRA